MAVRAAVERPLRRGLLGNYSRYLTESIKRPKSLHRLYSNFGDLFSVKARGINYLATLEQRIDGMTVGCSTNYSHTAKEAISQGV